MPALTVTVRPLSTSAISRGGTADEAHAAAPPAAVHATSARAAVADAGLLQRRCMAPMLAARPAERYLTFVRWGQRRDGWPGGRMPRAWRRSSPAPSRRVRWRRRRPHADDRAGRPWRACGARHRRSQRDRLGVRDASGGGRCAGRHPRSRSQPARAACDRDRCRAPGTGSERADVSTRYPSGERRTAAAAARRGTPRPRRAPPG